MKRALGMIIIIVAFVVGFLSIRGVMPFLPIFGSSMEPTLQSGSLMMIDPIDPYDIKVGDVIVYNVPSMIREYYNYPPVVAHRVVKVNKAEGLLSFRTQGDNTGEDPFSIRPENVRGKVGNQIPYLGFPLLFLQSQQGVIFVIVALTLLAIFLYSGELNRGGQSAHRLIFSPVIKESFRTNRELALKIDATDQKVDGTERALLKFASAIELYAQHLSSHTSAIQGLSEASHELKRSSAEQNKVIMRLMENMGQPGFRMEPTEQPKTQKDDVISQVEQTIRHLEKTMPEEGQAHPPGCFKSRREPPEENISKAS